MKRFLIIFIVFAFIISTIPAYADIDLSGMTFDELVSLKDQINLAIWNSAEWQEVTVPQGRWIVGEDIPAGKWTVKCADVDPDSAFLFVTQLEWGDTLDDDGLFEYTGRYGTALIFNPNNRYYEEGGVIEYTIELQDGDIFDVAADCAPAVFTPYSGKPSLGFK